MAFNRKDSIIPIPTHMKFVMNNPDEIGKEFNINLILLNSEWKAITFFTSTFKYNLKCSSAEEFLEYRDELYKNLKRGFCKATIKDLSTLEPKTFQVDLTIDSIPESKGGRKYELGKNRVSISEAPE